MADLKLALIVEAVTQAAQKNIDDLAKAERGLGTAAAQGSAQAVTAHAQHARAAEGAAKATEHVGTASHGVTRELIVLAHEVSQGNYSRFGGSMLVLGERIDILAKLASPAGIAIGVLVGTIAAGVTGVIKGAIEIGHLNDALRLTANSAGLTRNAYDQAAAGIAGATNGHIGQAREVLIGLVESGRFTANALVPVGRAIASVADASGEETGKVIADFAKMADGVTKWAAEHNRQYHFLTLDQFDRIEALEREGKSQEAVIATSEALYQQLERSKQPLSGLPALWHNLASSINSTWDALKNIGRGDSINDQIAAIDAKLKSLRTVTTGRGSSRQLSDAEIDSRYTIHTRGGATNEYRSLESQRAALVDQQNAAATKAAAAQTKATHDQEQIEAKEYIDKTLAAYKTGGEALAQAIAEFNRNADLLKGTRSEVSPADRAKVIAGIRKRFGGGDKAEDPGADIGNAQRTLKASLDETLAQIDASVAARQETEAHALSRTRQLWADYYSAVAADYEAALAKSALTPAQRAKLGSELTALKAEAATKDAQLDAKQTDLTLKGEEDRAKVVAETLKSVGDTRAAALTKLDSDYQQTLARLKNEGVSDAQAVTDAWRKAQEQAIAVDDLSSKVTEAQRRFQDTQVVAGARVQAGEETPARARSDVSAAARDEISALQGYRTQILKLIEDYPDDPKLVQILGTIDGELKKTGAIGNEVFNQFQQGLEGDFTTFFETISNGSKSAGSAFIDFGRSVIATIQKIAAEQLAKQLIGGLFGGGDSGGGLGGLFSGLGSLASSGTSFSDIEGAVIGSLSGGFATGGYVRGPGSDTSDNLRALLSPGEYVVSAKAVRRVGVGFLEAINGGAVKRAPSRALHFASGGLVGDARIGASGAAGGAPAAVSIENHYDFRGAGPDQLSQLYAYGERIKRDAVKAVFEAQKRGYAPK